MCSLHEGLEGSQLERISIKSLTFLSQFGHSLLPLVPPAYKEDQPYQRQDQRQCHKKEDQYHPHFHSVATFACGIKRKTLTSGVDLSLFLDIARFRAAFRF